MLIGEHQHNLDSKRRLAIPSKFRKELGDGAIITQGLDKCLFVLPAESWHKLASKLAEMPMGKQDARAINRLMLAGATEVEFDSLGRILIPEYLKQYADLKKEVIVTGVYTRLEIWNSESWAKYKTQLEQNSEAIAEKLGELGII